MRNLTEPATIGDLRLVTSILVPLFLDVSQRLDGYSKAQRIMADAERAMVRPTLTVIPGTACRRTKRRGRLALVPAGGAA